MKKRKSIGLWVGICLLFLGILGSVNVFAAANGVGKNIFIPSAGQIIVFIAAAPFAVHSRNAVKMHALRKQAFKSNFFHAGSLKKLICTME